MDIRTAQQGAREQQEWAACDPFTLVAAARDSLHGQVKSQVQDPQVTMPLEELISRFDQQTRASLGAGLYTTGSGISPR